MRSELLDSLVNYAGEVSIYRSRLEQQISTFRFNLIEFEQTVSRLREQLRKLEIETEAQIIARYQREQHEPGQIVVRSARARPLLAAAAALACARRVGIRSGLDSGPARRPDAPVRNAAAAAVARQLGSAGRPHAHAHGAVRFAGAEPAPHAAPGRAGSRQARTAARRRRARRNGPQPARAHEGAVRAHAAQRARARHRNARRTSCRRQAGRRHGQHRGQPRGDGSRAARFRRRQRHGPRSDPHARRSSAACSSPMSSCPIAISTASCSKRVSPPPSR